MDGPGLGRALRSKHVSAGADSSSPVEQSRKKRTVYLVSAGQYEPCDPAGRHVNTLERVWSNAVFAQGGQNICFIIRMALTPSPSGSAIVTKKKQRSG